MPFAPLGLAPRGFLRALFAPLPFAPSRPFRALAPAPIPTPASQHHPGRFRLSIP